MKCFSLFSGIGGFDLAAKRNKVKLVGACEIDDYAKAVYEKRFPKVPVHKDATKINPEELPDFDLLCAGFPCQAFSIAGKRKGFNDTRGSLFFEIARIAKEKRPQYLLLENVKGLLNHDNGETFRTIITTLDEVGYDAEWQVINSKHYIPQNRERVYIIGHLRGSGRRKIFPIGFDGGKTDYNELKQLGFIDKNIQGQRVYDSDNISCTLSANGGGWGAKTGLYAVVNDHGKLRNLKNASCLDANYYKGVDQHGARTMIYLSNTNANMKQRIQSRDNTWTLTNNSGDFGIVDGDRIISNTIRTSGRGSIDRHSWDIVKTKSRIRRLTPIECERLQGFPDNWTLLGADGKRISDTQRYKMCGNAVTVNVVYDIISRMVKNGKT